MKADIGVSRRNFMRSSLVATGVALFPAAGRIKAKAENSKAVADFSNRLCYNENPLGPSPRALDAMAKAASLSHRYPDWYSSNLASRIADRYRLERENVCMGTGATQIISLVADAFLSPGDELITADPTYFQMASEAKANGASVVRVPLDENDIIDLEGISKAISPKTKLIYLVNPNNPLGTVINKGDMETFLESLPEGIVVAVDEAYHHYAHSPTYESCHRFVKEGLPVVVIRTFSKAYGLAGARIGFSLATKELAKQIASLQLEAMLSNISQAAANASLDDPKHVAATVALNDKAKRYLESEFASMGLDFIPSETNFMMFDCGMDGRTVRSELESRGFRVRSGSAMPRYIRVSTGRMTEMRNFIATLKQVLDTFA